MDKKSRNKEIIVKYRGGSSMGELTKDYGLHRSTIQRMLKRNDIQLHMRKSTIDCNRRFFSVYNVESCYWAGFILADGNIRKNRNSLQIKLSNKDIDHLYKFITSISCDEFWRVKQYNDYCSLTISLDEFKDDLLKNFDIGPRKTLTAFISDKIPPNMLNHFIRGYMDGDGSISKSRTPSLSFVGTEMVLMKLKLLFKDKCGIVLKSKNETPPICNLNNGVGEISYSGKNANKILETLYRDSTQETILDRKYNKYKILFEKY